MRRAKANQQMHMIEDAADALGDSIRRANDSAFCSGSRAGCIPYSTAGGTPALQLRSIDHGDFSLVSPAVRSFDKASSNRILADILPFLRIAFVAAQNVIKESRLPKSRRVCRDRHGAL